MENEIVIKYTPDIENLTKVSKYLLNRAFKIKYFFLLFLFMSFSIFSPYLWDTGTIEHQEQKNIFDFSELTPLILVLVIWTVIYYRTLAQMKKTILNNKRNFETQKITFTKDSYTQEGETFKVTSYWNETYLIKETKDWFLIYPRKNNAFPLVKTKLDTNQLNDLKELFQTLSVKKSLK